MNKLLQLFIYVLPFFVLAQLPTQTVRGKVFDSETNFPLTGAKVLIEVDNQKYIGAANEAGEFSILKNKSIFNTP